MKKAIIVILSILLFVSVKLNKGLINFLLKEGSLVREAVINQVAEKMTAIVFGEEDEK